MVLELELALDVGGELELRRLLGRRLLLDVVAVEVELALLVGLDEDVDLVALREGELGGLAAGRLAAADLDRLRRGLGRLLRLPIALLPAGRGGGSGRRGIRSAV